MLNLFQHLTTLSISVMEYHEEFEDGVFLGSGFLENGKKTGKWSYFYETGELKNEIEYQDGIENGSFKLFHKNGQIAIECQHLNGSNVGVWKEYYESGQLQEVIEYINGEGFTLDFWDEDGTHLLKNGTGKKIVRYGGLFNDVWEQYFDKKQFIRETKISGAKFISFTPKGQE